ncbi:hypothetical protein [Methylorubrum extorquens]|uniref:Uncharacterized protein n=1 Tax=Methylorubrum extorquens DSM 13060 TaxID=882800 RepID=H1KHQ7_METEX|nr:hypothetical protein [Methylorubrum extorquens]EHP92935.1 hypothetical protein MetexDRAFT_2169 [Methylorubrum extorquens DSM 13060]
MSNARRTKTQAAEPSLRERVKVARASASRLSRRSGQAEAGPDPILAAIERHRVAARAFRDSADEADRTWEVQGGRDPAAEAAWQAADLAQIEAWNALFDTQPTTAAGLVALLRHVGEHAESMLDTGGTYTAASIFDGMASHVAALSGQLHGSRHCQASIIAARLGTSAAEWFTADDEGRAGELKRGAVEKRITTLSEAISYTRAASPAGMMGQLAVAFCAVDTVLNGRADLREAGARRAERCLLSIAAALCALSGIDREGCGASYMMSGQIDWMACLSPEAA